MQRSCDWAQARVALGSQELEIGVIQDSLGVLLKSQDDIEAVNKGPLQKILDQVRDNLKAQAELEANL